MVIKILQARKSLEPGAFIAEFHRAFKNYQKPILLNKEREREGTLPNFYEASITLK